MTASESRDFVSPAREAVLRVLSRERPSGAAAGFGDDPALASLPPADRHFADRLRRGVLQNRLLLDELLRLGGDFRFEKTDASLLWILRMAAYQKTFMGGVPDYAIGQQSVALARRHCGDRAAGFMNAVVRRSLARLPAGAEATDEFLASPSCRAWPLSTRVSVPDPVIRLLRGGYGHKHIEAVLTSLNRDAAAVTLRPNALRTTAAGLETALRAEGHAVTASPLLPGVLTWSPTAERQRDGGPGGGEENGSAQAHPAGPVWTSRAWAEGLCAVQDPGAMLAAIVLAPAPGESVLDWCAAPGGKTGQMWERMGGRGRLVALEINPGRREVLRETLARLYGAHEIEIAAQAADIPADSFNAVLVDAPCLALGLMRRHPEIRWDRRDERIGEITRTQLEVLTSAAEAVAPGGRLCYVTCSPTREENEDVIEAFLAVRTDFRAEDSADALPPDVRAWTLVKGAFIRTRPDLAETDGFCIRLLRRDA